MIGLGLYLVFLLFILVGLVTGVVLWTAGGRSRSGGEMACGSCGYAVRGLTQWACPECGADLREAGIRSGISSGRRVLGILLTIACGAVLLLSCVVPTVMFTLPSGPGSSSPVTYPNSSTGTATPAAPNTKSPSESNDADAEGSGDTSGKETDSAGR